MVVSDADERTGETDPARLSEELSARKGHAVRDLLAARGEDVAGKLLIASDTTVFCGGEILGKPRDAADARRMLLMLSGRRQGGKRNLALPGRFGGGFARCDFG